MSVATEIVWPRDIESALSEAEGRTLANLAEGKVVLELGAWLGCSTVCMAQTAERVFSVDWHMGDEHAGKAMTLGPFLHNLHRYGCFEQVVPIIGRFEHVLPALTARYFDLVFIDGCHSYESAERDATAAMQLVAGDGVIAIHDYGVKASSEGGSAFGVTQVVDLIFGGPSQRVDTLAIVREF